MPAIAERPTRFSIRADASAGRMSYQAKPSVVGVHTCVNPDHRFTKGGNRDSPDATSIARAPDDPLDDRGHCTEQG
jgi:hypothetical protein